MQLTKHIGCLLALVFATASAFAGDESVRPNFWFDATLAAELGQGWSGSTGSDYWSFANNVGKLNNMSATGENEYLTFTAEAKELPGDESTIKTSVKFTAMDKADFFTEQGNVPTIPDGAKGGLTIIEDSDTGATEFYGIVSNKWVALLGDTTAALAGQVDVEVKIRENNGKYISYKVGTQDLKLTSEGSADLATSFDGATISSVSYKGVCEIASLQGDAKDNLWELTLKTIADVQSVLYKVGSGEWTAVPQDNKIKATTETVQVKYVAKDGKYFFPDSTGFGKSELPGTEMTIKGDADFSNDPEFANVGSAIEAVAEVVNGGEDNKYMSIAAAVGAGNAVNVLKSANEPVTIGKALTLTANESVAISGMFTWTTGGLLTIGSGIYKGAFSGFGPETLSLAGGKFLYNEETAGFDIEDCCAKGFFATAYVGSQDYNYVIEAGTPISDPVDGKDIVLDKTTESAVKTAADGAGKSEAAYLADEAPNGLKRYVSYALGLGVTDEVATDKPKVAVVQDSDDTAINFAPNFKPIQSSGVKVTFKVDDVAADGANVSIPLSGLGAGVVTKKVEILVDGDIVATTTVGANKVTPKTTERTLVTVPWAADSEGTAISLNDFFKTSELVANDCVEIYDPALDTYRPWIWSGTAWQAGDVNGKAQNDATIPTLARGQAVWFTGAQAAYQVGVKSAGTAQVTVAEKAWGFVANPASGTAKALSAIVTTPVAGATAQVIDAVKGTSTIYTYKNGDWGYDGFTKDEKGKLKPGFVVPEKLEIAPGTALWFSADSETQLSF